MHERADHVETEDPASGDLDPGDRRLLEPLVGPLHLLHGLGVSRAAEHLRTLTTDTLIREICVDAELQEEALTNRIERFADQAFTFTDAISVAVMRSAGVRSAFTFDRHFMVGRVRSRAGTPR